MDPQVTWIEMIQSLLDNEQETASEHAATLLNWLDRGGFAPSVLANLGDAAGDTSSPVYTLNRFIVRQACAAVRTGRFDSTSSES